MLYSDIHVSQQPQMLRKSYLSCLFRKKVDLRLCGTLLGLSMFICVSLAQAQSVLGDTQGNSSLLNEEIPTFNTKSGTTISANTASDSVNLMYIWQKSPDSPTKLGFELSGRAANGIPNLFNNGGISSETIGNLFVGYRFGKDKENPEASDSSSQQVMFEIGLCRGAYNLLTLTDEGAPDMPTPNMPAAADEGMPDMPTPTNETSTETQTFPSIFLHYNKLIDKKLLGGLSVGYVRQSNYDTLDTRQLVTSRQMQQTEATPTDTEENVVISQLAVREGNYEEFGTFKINADLLYVPDFQTQKIGLTVFLRCTFRRNVSGVFEPGFGVFKLKEGQPQSETSEPTEQANEQENRISPLAAAADAPWKIVYGVIGQWDADKEEVQFGVVAGYNF